MDCMMQRQKKTRKGERDHLVRLERNVDSAPIWAPKAYANDLERRYPLSWRGEGAEVVVLAVRKYGQLRTFDKVVLTALVQLWHQQGRQPDGLITCQIIDIIELLERKEVDIGGRLYDQIKQSLYRLKLTGVQFINCFFNSQKQELKSTRSTHILYDLLIVEPKKYGKDVEDDSSTQVTKACLNLDVVQNLLGNYTRPVSLRFLQQLSERGVLFESYISGVLSGRRKITKDVFKLWTELGLSTEGYDYGSRLAAKMRKDLDKIAADPNSLLERYEFRPSVTSPRSKNLVLYRKAPVAAPATVDEKIRVEEELDEIDILVEEIRFKLRDESKNDTNLRRIAERMPKKVIDKGVHDAWGRFRDGQTPNPTRYFVGIMKNKAAELKIDLGINH